MSDSNAATKTVPESEPAGRAGPPGGRIALLRPAAAQRRQGALLGPAGGRPGPALSAAVGGGAAEVAAALAELKAFCDAHLDPAAIDRQAESRAR